MYCNVCRLRNSIHNDRCDPARIFYLNKTGGRIMRPNWFIVLLLAVLVCSALPVSPGALFTRKYNILQAVSMEVETGRRSRCWVSDFYPNYGDSPLA